MKIENYKGYTNWTIYDGIFSVTELNYYLKDEIRIRKNRLIGRKIKMNNTEFERIFDVYSNNSSTVLKLLNNDVMQELVNFYNTYKINYE